MRTTYKQHVHNWIFKSLRFEMFKCFVPEPSIISVKGANSKDTITPFTKNELEAQIEQDQLMEQNI